MRSYLQAKLVRYKYLKSLYLCEYVVREFATLAGMQVHQLNRYFVRQVFPASNALNQIELLRSRQQVHQIPSVHRNAELFRRRRQLPTPPEI